MATRVLTTMLKALCENIKSGAGAHTLRVVGTGAKDTGAGHGE